MTDELMEKIKPERDPRVPIYNELVDEHGDPLEQVVDPIVATGGISLPITESVDMPLFPAPIGKVPAPQAAEPRFKAHLRPDESSALAALDAVTWPDERPTDVKTKTPPGKGDPSG